MNHYCEQTGKLQFANGKDAWSNLKSVIRRKHAKRSSYNIYECPFCAMYHIGKVPLRPVRRQTE